MIEGVRYVSRPSGQTQRKKHHRKLFFFFLVVTPQNKTPARTYVPTLVSQVSHTSLLRGGTKKVHQSTVYA